MSNPFKSSFDSNCNSCGDRIFEDDLVYADDGLFYCEKCAGENGNVCECGNYKNNIYKVCYECLKKQQDEEKTY